MENKSWQDEAVEKSGVKVPEWELEPMGAEQKEKTMEANVEAEPSVAEKRLEEIAAETKEISLENPEQKAAQIETTRAEITEMAPKVPEQEEVKLETVTHADNVAHQAKRERNQSVNTFFAEERNKDRTWWQKISGKGKISAEDIAHEQALKINAKVDKAKEIDELFDISHTNTESSVEATREVNDGIIEELEKLGVNLEALEENGFKFDQEVLTKEKEPALDALREKMGSAMTNILDKLAKIDKEKVVGVSVLVGLVAAMVPVLGMHDLHSVISMLPDSVAHFLQSPELAGNPLWSVISPDGANFSMPSAENYMHQLDVFNNLSDASATAATLTEGNPFDSALNMSDPSVIAKLKTVGENEQDMHRMGSAFANLATIPVVMGATMYAGKIFGKIGKHFTGEKK